MPDTFSTLIAIGANLIAENGDAPLQTCQRAVSVLAQRLDLEVLGVSFWYETAPVGCCEGDPWYVNGVVRVRTSLSPQQLLEVLMMVERGFGRVRSHRNAPRVLDLDIVDYDGAVLTGEGLSLPHPRAAERAFVLYPLRDVVDPDWRHPVLGQSVDELIAVLPAEQEIRKIN